MSNDIWIVKCDNCGKTIRVPRIKVKSDSLRGLLTLCKDCETK